MAANITRRNGRLLRFVTAVSFGLAAFGVLRLFPFYPAWLVAVLALGSGALALSSPPAAALALAIAGSVPLVAADLVAGVVVMILALVATQYLAGGRATGFLLLALVAIALPVRAEWALVAVAGYTLGRGRGAAAAAAMCVSIEVAGILTGAPSLGTLATGGVGTGLIRPEAIGQATLGFGWLTDSIAAADPDRLLRVAGQAGDIALLGLQPLLWAAAALAAGSLRRARPRFMPLGGAVVAIAALALGSLGFRIGLGAPTSGLLPTALVSLVAAVAVVAAAEWVFPLETPAAPVAEVHGSRSEDADVDDLLRIIASAEDELAAHHQIEAVVLLSDMKSFSTLTEDLGSLESAKIVQRHRDLLLPLIARYRGKGKSTGGDGLVAAFTSPADAVDAAVDMQRTLRESCQPERRDDVLIRIGIAEGEVVLDKGGRPFLGGALNLAARVMDVADGGRVMVTGSVATALGDPPRHELHSHGEFKLKNIAEPLTVVEVLWDAGMAAQEIRAT